jgi:hypothetical protein
MNIFKFVRNNNSLKNNLSKTELLDCYWDFEINPISFDIIWMLSAATLFAKNNGYRSIRVNFIPENNPLMRDYPQNYLEVINRDSLEWRRRNICFSAPYLFPMVTCVSHWESRNGMDEEWKKSLITNGNVGYHWLYYKYINENFGLGNHSLKTSETGKNYIRKWANNLGISIENSLVITLREYGVDSIRNNDLVELEKFVEEVRADFQSVLLVRDTDKGVISNYFSKYHDCEIASINIELRAAIYELAKLNVAISSGPAALLELNTNARFIVSKFIHDNVAPAKKEFMEMKGFDINNSPSFLKNSQKWVWEKDTFDNLIKAYRDIVWE